jgi:uncharacterized membrane protein YjjP (DUF1212 family)
METNGQISVDEASAALAAAQRTRARVAWSGYPAWYWLTTGAGMGAVCYAVLQPGWWVLPLAAVAGLTLIILARAASRARGIREGCQRSSMTFRDQVVLGGPAALLILAGAAASKFVSWLPAVAAVLVFVVYAGTGLMLSARASRS